MILFINKIKREAVYSDGNASRRVKVYSDMVELLTLAPINLDAFMRSGLFDEGGFEDIVVPDGTTWAAIFEQLPHSGQPSQNPVERGNRETVERAVEQGLNMVSIVNPQTMKSVLVWVDNLKPVLFVIGTEGMPHLPLSNPYYDSVSDLSEYLA